MAASDSKAQNFRGQHGPDIKIAALRQHIAKPRTCQTEDSRTRQNANRRGDDVDGQAHTDKGRHQIDQKVGEQGHQAQH